VDGVADERRTVLTVGHGTASAEELRTLLARAGVELVVDVRRFPGSRRNPDVGRQELEQWLPAAGIGYRWEPLLGGRRTDDPSTAVDTWWRVAQFRAYAAYTRTDDFRCGLDDLLADAARRRTIIMCSESLWWRCHRRLVADVLVLLHGVPVLHLGHDGRLTPHRPSEGARVTDVGLIYDGRAGGRGVPNS
jgi:uncharacterized protein (DUF488 family)